MQHRFRGAVVLGACLAVLMTTIIDAKAQGPDSRNGEDDQKLTYPSARKADQVDDYHGTKVADPYRWLEDPDSAETRAWVEAQNRVTFSFLEGIPQRKAIAERLTRLWNYERFGTPFKEGGRYFYFKNDGLQNQSVLYTTESLDGTARVLIDPNTFSTDGTVALTEAEASPDGKYVVYGIATAGSDWQEFKVRDVRTGKDLDDHLKWIKFSGASWTRDGKGFYYSRYDEPNEKTKLEDANFFQKLYYHELGTPQSEDRLVYERKDEKSWFFNGQVTDDGRYLVIGIAESTENKNRVYYRELGGKKSAEIVKLIDAFEAEYSLVGNDGPVFWFKTTLDAPRGRIIAVDTRSPERKNWKEVVPESADTIQSVRFVNHQFVVEYLKDAHSQVKVFDTSGKVVREVSLPELGSVSGFTGEPDDTEAFYLFTSYTTPPTIYRLDMKSGKSEVFRKPDVDFDPSNYTTEQVFFKSKDGTRVPMFITYKKGLERNGQNPTILYGYGGFNVSLTPGFSVTNLVWMEMGGIYAVPNLRGGGEYGEAWHEAGTKLSKQNVFDDFIAAAEWLIANKYTSTEKLAISGGSNGGLLVGAAMTQRPDLFGAALPAVGVMDMLRFHKFTIGWAWTSDYGSPENPDEFKALQAYSPLHNLKPGTEYPATLVTTADHDDRVVPAHSFKFAAALQAAHAGSDPVLIRIETRAGHGAGKPTAKIIEEAADRLAFLVRVLEI